MREDREAMLLHKRSDEALKQGYCHTALCVGQTVLRIPAEIAQKITDEDLDGILGDIFTQKALERCAASYTRMEGGDQPWNEGLGDGWIVAAIPSSLRVNPKDHSLYRTDEYRTVVERIYELFDAR